MLPKFLRQAATQNATKLFCFGELGQFRQIEAGFLVVIIVAVSRHCHLCNPGDLIVEATLDILFGHSTTCHF